MSRIGKLPIPVPAGVTVTVDEDNLVTVKGPKGTLSQKVNTDIDDLAVFLRNLDVRVDFL